MSLPLPEPEYLARFAGSVLCPEHGTGFEMGGRPVSPPKPCAVCGAPASERTNGLYHPHVAARAGLLALAHAHAEPGQRIATLLPESEPGGAFANPDHLPKQLDLEGIQRAMADIKAIMANTPPPPPGPFTARLANEDDEGSAVVVTDGNGAVIAMMSQRDFETIQRAADAAEK